MSAVTVSARDLTRTFGAFVAVDRVSFEVRQGEVFGFLGSNGAGKTTTIRMLCGLLAPTSGEASVAGYDIATHPEEVKRRIGYMSQRFSLYADLSVEENLRFWAGAYGLYGGHRRERVQWGLEVAGLGDRRRKVVRDLPGGLRQRLALASALLHDPPVVFLDEPTGGVDPEARRRFWDLIEDLVGSGKTVFVTTHYMDEAERCHRVALMHAGRIIALGSLPELKQVFSPGSVLEVTAAPAARAMAALEGMREVEEVSLFGTRLHVTLADPNMRDAVAAVLEREGLSPVHVRPISPGLEDVFIRVVSRAEQAQGTQAHSQSALGSEGKV